jgi:hypothetical protein
MTRAAAFLVLLILVSIPTRCAHAQLPPGWTSGGLTASLPSAEVAPARPVVARPHEDWARVGALRTWVHGFSIPSWHFSTGRTAPVAQRIVLDRRPTGVR